MWGVVALTVATFTVLLAARRILVVGSEWVFSRYMAVGGLVAFSADSDDSSYRVRFEVGGPGVFHNVNVQLFGVPDGSRIAELGRPAVRHTMAAGDAPIEWTFQLHGDAAERAWVMVTWVRPYLQGVGSEALAQWLATARLYEWRWYSETTRYVADGGSFRGPTVVAFGTRVDARLTAVRAVAAHVVEHQRRPVGPG